MLMFSQRPETAPFFGGALRAGAEAVAVQFRDLKLQMGDQGLIVGNPGLGCCEFAPLATTRMLCH